MALAGRMPGPGFIVKAGDAETLGAYSVFESTLSADTPGPLPHVHMAEEAWYVIEGTMKFSIGEEEFIAGAGSFVLAPRGTLHSFSNIGGGTAKHLTIFSPPRDALWTAVSEMREAARDASLDIERLIALYDKYGEDTAALGQNI
jgi:mannose-6-phosphate isomerase-like protein (cupin superfamily)